MLQFTRRAETGTRITGMNLPMTSDGRAGLEGEKTFTVAGLPTLAFVAEQRLLNANTEPPLLSF